MKLYLRRNGCRAIVNVCDIKIIVYTFIVSNCKAHSASMDVHYRRIKHCYYYIDIMTCVFADVLAAMGMSTWDKIKPEGGWPLVKLQILQFVSKLNRTASWFYDALEAAGKS